MTINKNPFTEKYRANSHLYKRLRGIQSMLMSIHAGTVSSSAASKGTEREAFIRDFLANVLPPIYRFGTGDVTDKKGKKSGQLDVVVEYPHSPTLPLTLGSRGTRLYLAEAVAAVIEIKSDVSNQWKEVRRTASQLAKVKRQFGAIMSGGKSPEPRIPLFAVGYKGWKSMKSLAERLNDEAEELGLWGILVIEGGFFMMPNGWSSEGPWALWGLMFAMNHVTTDLISASTAPEQYAGQQFRSPRRSLAKSKN
jgi:hypothetical protein